MPGITSRVSSIVDSRFTSTMSRISSSGISANARIDSMPALFTSTSIGPSSDSTCWTMRRRSSSDATSATTGTAPIESATVLRSPSDRAVTATFAPRLASSPAMTFPMPREAPVTTVTAPLMSMAGF